MSFLAQLPSPPPGKTGWPWTEESSQLSETMLDGTPWPRISIVTPSYNQGWFIETSIRSVLLQGYPNLQYIIIDGHSTDNSVEIIQKYQGHLSYWASEPDAGQTYAIHKGMQYTDGEIVNWLNVDDYLLPGALVKIAETWRKSQTMSVFCGGGIYVSSDGTLLSSRRADRISDSAKLLPSGPSVSGGIQASCFLTKDLWNMVGGIDVKLDYTMDTDLYYRCWEKNANFVIVNQDIAAYCVHVDTKTRRGWEKSVNYKKQFYLSKCNRLTKDEQDIYLPRIRRFLCVQCLNSISSQDGLVLRMGKIVRAVKESPEYFLVPYQFKTATLRLLGQ